MRDFHKLSAIRFCMVLFFPKIAKHHKNIFKKQDEKESSTKISAFSQPSPASRAMAGLSQSQPLPPRRPPSVDARPETADGARERSPSPNTEYLGWRVQSRLVIWMWIWHGYSSNSEPQMDQCSTGKLDIKGYKLRIFCLDVEWWAQPPVKLMSSPTSGSVPVGWEWLINRNPFRNLSFAMNPWW